MVSKNWTEKAKELRAQGMSYAKIGVAVGKSAECIHYTLNPKTREQRNRAKKKRYRDNRQKILDIRAKYYQENKEATLKQHAKYKREHWPKIAARNKVYRQRHEDEIKKQNAIYCREHRPECNARTIKYRAFIAGATIGNLVEIAEIYRRAKEDPKVRCYLCGRLIPIGERQVDHIWPLSKGGAHRPSNLAIAHRHCNQSKNAKLPQEIGLLL